MKEIKRIFCLVLVLALLCATPLAPRAHGENLTTANVSGYPALGFHGGFHELIINENTPAADFVFMIEWIGDLLAARLDDLLACLMALDFDGAVDVLKEIMWEWFGPIRMDENGDSRTEGITRDGPFWLPEYDGWPGFDTDWRLSPIENAEKLHEYLEYACDRYGVEKFNLRPISGTVPIVLAYLDAHGYDRIASICINITTHNGSTVFGELFTRRMVLDMEALAKMQAFDELGMDLSALSPILRALFEPGILSVLERFLRLAAGRIIDRVYDEIIIPLVSMTPGFWTYVPLKDYEAAKKALLGCNPNTNLVEKLDAWHDVALRADDIIREAAEHVKVGVWAGYGSPLPPLGKSNGTNSDFVVDTKYASLGATCAPLDLPFLPGYRQKAHRDHSHISPDRMIDASTCLLPDQTWFARNKPHGWEDSYSGWHEWFLETDNPTVFENERYPQFMDAVQSDESDSGYEYFPIAKLSDSETLLLMLKTVGLHLLKIWRWLLVLPLFWVDWV